MQMQLAPVHLLGQWGRPRMSTVVLHWLQLVAVAVRVDSSYLLLPLTTEEVAHFDSLVELVFQTRLLQSASSHGAALQVHKTLEARHPGLDQLLIRDSSPPAERMAAVPVLAGAASRREVMDGTLPVAEMALGRSSG